MRKITAERLMAQDMAQSFAGLRTDIHHMQLLDALEIAAERYGLADHELRYLRFMFRQTRVSDWHAGREPIVGWPRIEIARALGKTERSIHRIESGLVAKGLIVHRDGPRFARFAVRAGNDMLSASGVSLAPIGSQSDRILQAAAETIEEAREWRRLRKSATHLRRELVAAATGQHQEAARATILSMVSELPERHEASTPLHVLKELVRRAAETLQHALVLVTTTIRTGPDGEPSLSVDPQSAGASMSSQGDTDVLPNNTHINPSDSCPVLAETEGSSPPYPAEFLDAFSAHQDICNPGARAIAAAETFSAMLGLSPSVVHRAIGMIGLPDTLECLRIYHHATKPSSTRPPIRNPEGYVFGLVKRHLRGDLRRPASSHRTRSTLPSDAHHPLIASGNLDHSLSRTGLSGPHHVTSCGATLIKHSGQSPCFR